MAPKRGGGNRQSIPASAWSRLVLHGRSFRHSFVRPFTRAAFGTARFSQAYLERTPRRARRRPTRCLEPPFVCGTLGDFDYRYQPLDRDFGQALSSFVLI